MNKLLPVMIIVMAVAIGSTLPAAPPTHAQDNIPNFLFHDCPSGPQYPRNRTVECGTLVVPENRSNPDSRLIQLAVFIVRASGEARPDPLVYLEGGPGAGASEWLSFFEYAFGPYADDRDVILMDQRGTGYSVPSLQCEPYGVANFEAYASGLALEEGSQRAADALLGCYNDYLAQGIDMNAYTSAENAADFEDLRVALGIDQWNLYGISYGTRLALTIMRDHPAGIRSVIIDSVVPPIAELYVETPANGAAALDRLFDLCAQDTACNTAYPDLETKFYAVVDRLNAAPLSVSVERPTDGRSYPAVLNGDTLVGIMFFNMYSTFAIQNLPYAINEAYDGNYAPLQYDYLPGFFAWDGIATAMHYSLNCNEEIAFDTFEEIEAASDTLDPRLQFFYDVDNYVTYYICEGWETAPANPLEIEPVVSVVPTLVITGELDPITPPRWGELAAETLSNVQVINVPNAGHGATLSFACPRDLMETFLDSPTGLLDTSCLADIAAPTFQIR